MLDKKMNREVKKSTKECQKLLNYIVGIEVSDE